MRGFQSSAVVAALALALALSACGSDDNPVTPTPTPPTPIPIPPPVLNAPPRITSMTAEPSFGIATLTSFAMTAAATDPEGDPVTFEWELGDGTRASGPTVSKTYLTGGNAIITLTVADGRGGSTIERRTITVGSLTGTWVGALSVGNNDSRVSTMSLVQVGGVVTGTMTIAPNSNGQTDPAQLGKIDANGTIEIRWKVDQSVDFTMRGQMDQTGTRILGATFGSGEPFIFDKR